MKLKKNAKPLIRATLGDLTTDRTCGFCGLNLQIATVDPEEKLAWLSCPAFLAKREFSKNEHSSFAVPLYATGYVPGDEKREAAEALLRNTSAARKRQHDRPKKTAQPAGAFSRR